MEEKADTTRGLGKTSNPIYFSSKFGPPMTKALVSFIATSFTLALLSGCVGMAADSIARSIVTGKTYGEMTTALPPPTEGNGRLYIYRTSDSTKISPSIGIGLLKNPTLCTVDDTAYELIWEAFEYFDLPEGQHEITCGTDVLKKTDFWSSKQHYQRGASKVLISMTKAAATFVRVDPSDKRPFFQPVVVEQEQGRAEIVNLPYQKKQGHTYGGGKIDAP